jgi:methionyl-tRNA synthetase
LPWDPKHVTYVWFDALFNYCTAVGYGTDQPRFGRTGRPTTTSSARTSSASAVLLARHVDVGGHRAAQVGLQHWLAPRRGEKMSKTSLNQIAPADLVADFGVDGFRFTTSWPISASALTATLLRSDGQRYNADLANNFGNLANRVLNMAMNYVGGVAPADRDRAARRR